jgi:sulfate transport system substrate-binding protein
MKKLFLNVPVLDTGARGATTTFVQRQIGDVLLAWENEAFLAINELGQDQFEIVMPSMSILAEPPVTVVDANAQKHEMLEAARAYLEFLYTPAAQQIIGENYYRPTNPQVAARFARQFPAIRLVTIDGAFGGWQKAQARHFNDGGTFDEIYAR